MTTPMCILQKNKIISKIFTTVPVLSTDNRHILKCLACLEESNTE